MTGHDALFLVGFFGIIGIAAAIITNVGGIRDKIVKLFHRS